MRGFDMDDEGREKSKGEPRVGDLRRVAVVGEETGTDARGGG
jgi:hypothetical protein